MKDWSFIALQFLLPKDFIAYRVTVEHARGLPRRGGYGGYGRDRDRDRRPAWLDRWGIIELLCALDRS